jgi:hypothetical protein
MVKGACMGALSLFFEEARRAMRTRLGNAATVAMVGVLAGACASGTGGAAETNGVRGAVTVVEVSNHNWSDVNVYAVHLGTRMRLGTVVSMTTRKFTLPARALVADGTLRLMASPIGSTRTYVTDPILVGQGDRVEWNLENRLALSSYMVRNGTTR